MALDGGNSGGSGGGWNQPAGDETLIIIIRLLSLICIFLCEFLLESWRTRIHVNSWIIQWWVNRRWMADNHFQMRERKKEKNSLIRAQMMPTWFAYLSWLKQNVNEPGVSNRICIFNSINTEEIRLPSLNTVESSGIYPQFFNPHPHPTRPPPPPPASDSDFRGRVCVEGW